ncbi:MAG: flagellar hook-length control protein FliK [Ancrocorticia sp.]|nr:flagellar hook-length control protein FliK [Ancrocorticia sp.]MCI2193151.1 flagellar hook-length control protein FliK [Ancrocorticia sp.]MCI2198849.1 flagellar hook-length control protein FliK [Ancrocorticia sp.]
MSVVIGQIAVGMPPGTLSNGAAQAEAESDAQFAALLDHSMYVSDSQLAVTNEAQPGTNTARGSSSDQNQEPEAEESGTDSGAPSNQPAASVQLCVGAAGRTSEISQNNAQLATHTASSEGAQPADKAASQCGHIQQLVATPQETEKPLTQESKAAVLQQPGTPASATQQPAMQGRAFTIPQDGASPVQAVSAEIAVLGASPVQAAPAKVISAEETPLEAIPPAPVAAVSVPVGHTEQISEKQQLNQELPGAAQMLSLNEGAVSANNSAIPQGSAHGSGGSSQDGDATDAATDLNPGAARKAVVSETAMAGAGLPNVHRSTEANSETNGRSQVVVSERTVEAALPQTAAQQGAQSSTFKGEIQNALFSADGSTTARSDVSTSGATYQPLARQIGNAMAHLRSAPDGHYVFSARVHPEDLGPIRVTAHLRSDGLHVELAGLTPAAARALREALPELRHSLLTSGIRSDATLSVAGDTGGADSSFGESLGGNSHGTDAHDERFTGELPEAPVLPRAGKDLTPRNRAGDFSALGHVDVVI